jgi:hypothetical protein
LLQASAADPILSLLLRCHESLRKTRGVAMSLATFDARAASMTWTGVGNVEGVLLRATLAPGAPKEGLCTRSGIVGFQVPPLHASTVSVSPGDTLILATDGIGRGFTEVAAAWLGPQQIADGIVTRFAKANDDAHVVVARYVGAAS